MARPPSADFHPRRRGIRFGQFSVGALDRVRDRAADARTGGVVRIEQVVFVVGVFTPVIFHHRRIAECVGVDDVKRVVLSRFGALE